MPKPSLRSKKYHIVRTPGGRYAIHYLKEKRNKDKCAICKSELHGTNHGYKSLPRSSRRPKRIFGGYLCSNCLKKILENKIIESFQI
jgi:large subunit ribosomal protein L34e